MLLKAIRYMKSKEDSNKQEEAKSIHTEEGVKCEHHPDREIEFYCTECNTLVCSRCMFFQHNGHQLCLLEDAIEKLEKEMDSLYNQYDKYYTEEYSKTERNEKQIQAIQKELESNKLTQIKLIRQGFDKIVEALVRRKELLVDNANKKYDDEIQNTGNSAINSSSKIRPIDEIRREVNKLKNTSTNGGKKELTEKASKIKDYNDKLKDVIKDAKMKGDQNSKLPKIDHDSHQVNNGIGEDFTPIPIDSTTAISYILNMTLENQSIADSRVKHSGSNQEASKGTSKTPSNRVSGNKVQLNQPKAKNISSDFKVPGNSFNVQNMNIMKNRSSHRTKTVDTDKRSASEGSAKNQDFKFGSPDSRQVQNKISGEDKDKATGIYCIGDLPFLLFFHCPSKEWSKIEFSEESVYKGGLKYPCVVIIPDTDIIMITGGCDNYTGEASESVFRANVGTVDTFRKVNSMKHKRYGHCSACIQGHLYVAGGFDHQDTETTVPSTLVTCERYDYKSGKWSDMASLIHPIAFAAICSVSNKYLFVFGGFEDYSTVDVIQKYNCAEDQWDLMSIKLPVRLAKMGAACIENENILIVGGIYEDLNSETPLSLISNSYKLNLNKMTWSKTAKMKNKRTLNSTLYSFDNQIYVVGSSNEGACEKYDYEVNRWINIPSYDSILPQNDLQSFSVCMFE